MKATLYQVLGVSESATAEEIKAAYRTKAKLYHPDRTGGDKVKEAKFKAVSEAYETLSDPGRRAVYDQDLKDERTAPERAEITDAVAGIAGQTGALAARLAKKTGIGRRALGVFDIFGVDAESAVSHASAYGAARLAERAQRKKSR